MSTSQIVFLLFLNDPSLLKECNASVYAFFSKFFNNIEEIVNIVSKPQVHKEMYSYPYLE